MSANLVDVDAFTSPVVVPVDGDALTSASVIQGLQPLANRTANLNGRLTATDATLSGVGKTYASLAVSGSAVAINAKFGLSGAVTGGDASITGGDTLTFSQSGLYLVTAQMSLAAGDLANPTLTGFNMDVGGATVLAAEGTRFSGDVDDLVFLTITMVLAVSPGTAVSLKARFGHTSGTFVNNGSLIVMRIK
jgi:hypothetical protein